MVSGQLAVADLPDAWREGMLELLGVAPDADDHAQGCMQDLHWCDAAAGACLLLHAQANRRASCGCNGAPHVA